MIGAMTRDQAQRFNAWLQFNQLVGLDRDPDHKLASAVVTGELAAAEALSRLARKLTARRMRATHVDSSGRYFKTDASGVVWELCRRSGRPEWRRANRAFLPESAGPVR